MKIWQIMDIAGKSIVLLSVLVQLFVLSDIQGSFERSFMYYVLDNQANERTMLMVMAKTAAPREVQSISIGGDMAHYDQQSAHFSDLKEAWSKPLRIAGGVNGVLFLAGSIILLYSRALEFHDKDSLHSRTNRPSAI
jgi:hypothetical protein